MKSVYKDLLQILYDKHYEKIFNFDYLLRLY